MAVSDQSHAVLAEREAFRGLSQADVTSVHNHATRNKGELPRVYSPGAWARWRTGPAPGHLVTGGPLVGPWWARPALFYRTEMPTSHPSF